jgi:Leucine-rich repeat (LRR) protein
MNDLELIKQVEKEMEKLQDVSPGSHTPNSFEVDVHNHVVELFIVNAKMDPFLATLAKLKYLEKLFISMCEFSDTSILKEFKRLTFLDLAANQISDIAGLQGLKGLTFLNLCANRISDISDLKELKGLTVLDLCGNQIRDFSVLKELTGLKELYLAGTKISDISVLKELTNLTMLDLRDNKIAYLPPEFAYMGMEIKWERDETDGIFLARNPLKSPPVKIVKQGTEAVRKYFKTLERES